MTKNDADGPDLALVENAVALVEEVPVEKLRGVHSVAAMRLCEVENLTSSGAG